MKNYLIFGGGITGSAIARELSKIGFVFVVDIKNKAELLNLPNEIKFIKFSNNKNFIKTICKNYNIYFDSIIHTHLQTVSDLKIFLSQVELVETDQIVTLGTLMTYNQTTWQKLNLKTDNIWNNYQYQKRSLEVILQKWCIEKSIKLFIPESFHILGAGYGIGIVGPYFRMNQIQLEEYKKEHYIVLPDNNPKVILDNKDFAKFIAIGISTKLNGFYQIFNPKLITPKEYYSFIDKKLGINRQIIVKPFNLIEPMCMNQEWNPNLNNVKNFEFTPSHQSINETIDHLLNTNFPMTRDIYSVMITSPL
jgi:hypothetical protein